MSPIQLAAPRPIDGERHCRGHGARLRRHFPGRNPAEIGANAWVRGIVGR